MRNSRKHQQGHAAILFAMMIPALFGIFALASDGARAIQTKARIEDASEVAALAISAHNDPAQPDDGSYTPSTRNRQIVVDYVNAYISDIDAVTDIKVAKRRCELISDCVTGIYKGDMRYLEHEIDVTTRQNSWFPGNEAIEGMGETFSTRGKSLARKYQSEAVDVMFAADFSGSMLDTWSGSSNPKYADLIEIIRNISVELQKFNDLPENRDKSTMGISAFSTFTNSSASYSGIQCSLTQGVKNNGKPAHFWWQVSYGKTVDNIWVDKGENYCLSSSSTSYHDINLTSNFHSLNSQVSSFYPNGGTASYQALIRGAQLLDRGHNSRRLLIVLSDGMDNHIGLADGLVSAGMCRNIQSGLESDRTPDGRPIAAKMAVIGFDYNPFANKALKDCVGEKNVYKAEDADEVEDIILELINEEIGHLK
ncbi:TadE/TadG family type IV pilus assembly protein [Aliivibrio fischeri]|uniref:TadE/TadG family type IV pilus assembly protein n=1 Tax=Aliivibrio fischeri TaxID=668 RepID=UPI0012D9ACF9|nr:pilus assembly protein [Aliivibrio fischeri]MUK28025.1 TadG [Aliivibrio fischeri]MUK34991.1 TadG [Aliivibrio fischeri]